MDKRDLSCVVLMLSPESLREANFDVIECERHQPKGSVSWTAWKKALSKSGRQIAYSYTVIHYLGDLHYEMMSDEDYLISVISSLMDSELIKNPVVHKGHNESIFSKMESSASCYRVHAAEQSHNARSPHGNRKNKNGN
jgi:hypothetical protein